MLKARLGGTGLENEGMGVDLETEHGKAGATI